MTARTLIIGLTAATLAAAACESDTPTGPSTPPPPSSLIALLAPGAMTIAVGDTAQIRAMAALRDQPDELVTTSGTWQSSDSAIVTVDNAGVIRGMGIGTADVSVTRDELTATVAVTVAASTSQPTTLSGAAAAAGTETATVVLTIDDSARAIATVYFASTAVDLIGRLDAPTGTVHVTGGGYSFLGTLGGSTLAGTFTDPAGRTGAFAAIESTRTAVTPYCGSYTTGGSGGAFVLALSFEGRTVGAAAPDSGSTPVTLTGERSGDALAMTTNLGAGASGAVQGGTIAGSFETAGGSTGDYTATSSACH
jgi:hypothetical protein